jgi:hypothetical protein
LAWAGPEFEGAAPKNLDFAAETVALATVLGFGPNILDFSTI